MARKGWGAYDFPKAALVSVAMFRVSLSAVVDLFLWFLSGCAVLLYRRRCLINVGLRHIVKDFFLIALVFFAVIHKRRQISKDTLELSQHVYRPASECRLMHGDNLEQAFSEGLDPLDAQIGSDRLEEQI